MFDDPKPNKIIVRPMAVGQIDGIGFQSPSRLVFDISDDQATSIEQALVEMEDRKFDDDLPLNMLLMATMNLGAFKRLVQKRREVLEGIPSWEALAGTDVLDADLEDMKERVRQRIEDLDALMKEGGSLSESADQELLILKAQNDDLKRDYNQIDETCHTQRGIIEKQAKFISELVTQRQNPVPFIAAGMTVGIMIGIILSGLLK